MIKRFRDNPTVTRATAPAKVWRGLILVCLCLGLAAVLPEAQPAQATSGINQEINYQARLLNSAGATVPDGNYNIEFKIYSGGTGCVGGGTSPCGGTNIWSEDWLNNNSQGVTVTNGYFSVMLGAASDPLGSLDSQVNFNQTPLWLSINIGNTNTSCATFSACSGDGEMLPFTQFAAAPYAFDAESVGGVLGSSLVQLSPGSQQTGNINVSGTYDSNTFNSNSLQFGGPSTATLQSASSQALNITANAASTWSTSAGNLTIQAAGSSTLSLDTAGAGTVDVGTNATTVTLGAGSAAETINVGDSSTSNTINIGAGAGTDNVNIGTSGNPVTSLDVYGPILLNTPSNTTTALQVQNANDSNVLTVDTADDNLNNLITNPSFENNSTAGWSADGSCGLSAVTSAATPPFNGLYSGQCSNTGIGQGFKYVTGALTPNTIYALDFDAKVSATPGNVLNFGHVENGGAEDVAGLSMTSQSVLSNGWTHYSLTFKTGATLSSSDYIYIKQNDATTRDLWVDGVTLQTDANANNAYQEGEIQVGGVISSPLILQNASNSSTAFQVQDANGANIFTVSTNDTNLLPNPGAEVNTAGWSGKGSGTIIRDTSQQRTGVASFKITTTTSNNDGAQYTGLNLADGTYSIGFAAQLSSGTFAAGGLQAGITNTAGDNACTLAPAVSTTVPATTGWTQFTCTVTITTTVGTAFFIRDNDSAAHTFWVDDVELDSGSTLTPYGLGGVSLNAVINTPLALQNQSNSTSALALYNVAGAALLNVDTLNSIVNLGINGSTATASTINLATTTGAATQTVNIGSTSSASNAVLIKGGTGATAIQLQVGASGTISVGTTSQTSTLDLGNTGGTAVTLINGGNGGTAIGLQAATSGIISLGTTNVNTVTVGSTVNTGTLTFGQSTAGETIDIGDGNVASGKTNTINIGAAATSTGKDAITIGN
ncbi:MAG TPA: carbohydrate binding domain-containing protein, partial [Candidatus Saccharimonadales bacterium]|nr:carbohydrate binding domain-containing protein [Candidatus Saccharimonadales bacterium]